MDAKSIKEKLAALAELAMKLNRITDEIQTRAELMREELQEYKKAA